MSRFSSRFFVFALCLTVLLTVSAIAVEETLTYKVTVQPPVGGGPALGPVVVITITREAVNVQSDARHPGAPAILTNTEKFRWWPTELELGQLCQGR